MNPAPFVHSALAMTRRLKRRDRCPLAWLLDVWRWHKCEVSRRPLYRRCRGQSGSNSDIVKLTRLTPSETWSAIGTVLLPASITGTAGARPNRLIGGHWLRAMSAIGSYWRWFEVPQYLKLSG